eukprot:COSAG01_NODE_26682_length_706_cov_0.899506_2_plen_98_part_00
MMPAEKVTMIEVKASPSVCSSTASMLTLVPPPVRVHAAVRAVRVGVRDVERPPAAQQHRRYHVHWHPQCRDDHPPVQNSYLLTLAFAGKLQTRRLIK